jgi:hypothetical protein
MKKQIVRFLIVLVACLLAFSVFKFRNGRSFSSNRVPAETPAPVQTAGTSFIYNFDNEKSGLIPANFHSVRTGPGAQGQWLVIPDPSAPTRPNVVAQNSADPTDSRLVLLVANQGSFKDLRLSVKFKTVSGEVDRAAGLAFRLKDANNYYVLRVNTLEDNCRLYRVVAGKKRPFAGANFEVGTGEWHELTVECVGNKIICYYDGKKQIEATDDTFADAGKVGLWTKADSVTYFDDLTITAK